MAKALELSNTNLETEKSYIMGVKVFGQQTSKLVQFKINGT
jgi:hypothetical protein